MQWKINNPKHDDVQSKKRFAFWPVKTRDHYWVWLEFVLVNEQYNEYRKKWFRYSVGRLNT